MTKRKVFYIYSDSLIKEADKNPVVKGRASMVHSLISSYDLLKHLIIVEPKICNPNRLLDFHSRDYIDQLFKSNNSSDDDSSVEIDNLCDEYGLGFDCPTFPNIMEYACKVASGTIAACQLLCEKQGEMYSTVRQPIVLNWTGGWHHAHRDKAAGFCYINDIVLGILVLRKHFQRILYVDLDVHHGDGVQEAFETTKRVFTLSFHQYECGFYPGTGSADDCGFAGGRGYAANFPYKSCLSAANLKSYFNRSISLIFKKYSPDVCVIQAGADAIVGDTLGGTNLTSEDLIECIKSILDWNLPTVILGGGGYNFQNTSRYWASLTSHLCEQKLNDDIPEDDEFFLNYGPDYTLNILPNKFMKDLNTEAYLEKCIKTIEDNLIKYNVGDF